MRNGIEVLAQIGIDYIRIPLDKQLMNHLDRLLSTPLRSIGVSIRFQIRFEDWLQHQFGGRLRHPVPNRRDSERA